jgi:hypothetical protein
MQQEEMNLKPAAACLGLLYGLAVAYLVLLPSVPKTEFPQHPSVTQLDRCETGRDSFC